jgi:DNA-binding MarR family transcriptional regulator
MISYKEESLPHVFQLIEQVNKKLKGLQSLTLRQTGLTPAQFYILSLLWERDGRPFKDLAEALNCSRASITGIVDSLERKGYAFRAPNPQDRRSQFVRLTSTGCDLRSTVPDLERQFQSCCDGLTAAEIQKLFELLVKLNEMLGATQ